jgi:hypothetical protein
VFNKATTAGSLLNTDRLVHDKTVALNSRFDDYISDPSGQGAAIAVAAYCFRGHISPPLQFGLVIVLTSMESDFTKLAPIKRSTRRGYLSVLAGTGAWFNEKGVAIGKRRYPTLYNAIANADMRDAFAQVIAMCDIYDERIRQHWRFTTATGWVANSPWPTPHLLEKRFKAFLSDEWEGRMLLYSLLHVSSSLFTLNKSVDGLEYGDKGRYVGDVLLYREWRSSLPRLWRGAFDSIPTYIRNLLTKDSVIKQGSPAVAIRRGQIITDDMTNAELGDVMERGKRAKRDVTGMHPKHHIVSWFGPRSAKYGSSDHKGLDFHADLGTPVYSVASGRIVDVYHKDGPVRKWDKKKKKWALKSTWGHAVVLLTDTGAAYRYAHLLRPVVKKYDRIDRAGILIGYTGKSGTVDPHFHFEYMPDGSLMGQRDPLSDPLRRWTQVFLPSNS